MALAPMAPGGVWMKPPHDGPYVYLAAKQRESHYKRLVGDGWLPVEDPRREEEQSAQATPVPPISTNELALQAKVDQLEALVKQLLEQQQHGSPGIHEQSDSETSPDASRSKRGKSAL